MRDEFGLILDSLRNSWNQAAVFLPRLLVALALLTVGWLLARVARRIAVGALRLMRLDTAAERTGLDDFLLRGGVRLTLVTLLGQMVYWSTLLIFVVAVFSVLGLRMGPDSVDQLAAYAPRLVVALAVLVFGSLGARFIRGVTEAYLNNVGVRAASSIGALVQIALFGLVAILALEQLGLALSLLASAFQLAFGGLCLGLALAFGLGGRAWAEAILERTRSRR